MNTTDVRFDEHVLATFKSFIGKKMTKYEHVPFRFTNSVPQFVRFCIDGNPWYLYCFSEEHDYFGATEDVSVLYFDSNEYPFFAEKQCISNPIDEVIEKVVVVQENQRLYENSRLLYDVWITRGLIFDFGDHQISFEKGPWLSEQIVIRKGYNLISEFTPESRIMGPFSNNGVMNCERTIITIC